MVFPETMFLEDRLGSDLVQRRLLFDQRVSVGSKIVLSVNWLMTAVKSVTVQCVLILQYQVSHLRL